MHNMTIDLISGTKFGVSKNSPTWCDNPTFCHDRKIKKISLFPDTSYNMEISNIDVHLSKRLQLNSKLIFQDGKW